jgi:hypothetical protein
LALTTCGVMDFSLRYPVAEREGQIRIGRSFELAIRRDFFYCYFLSVAAFALCEGGGVSWDNIMKMLRLKKLCKRFRKGRF